MRLRRTPSYGNMPGEQREQTPFVPLDGSGPLLTPRAALILLAALVIGAAAGILAHLAGTQPAEAVLTGGGAFGAVVALLHTIISR